MARRISASLTFLILSTLLVPPVSGICPEGPQALGETFHLFSRAPVLVDVLANDSHPCGVPLELSSAANVDCDGDVVENFDDTLTFTPSPLFTGSCQIGYWVGDEEGADPVTATLTIDGTLLPPLQPTPLDERRLEALHVWNDHLALSGPGTFAGDHDRPDVRSYHWQKILVLLALHELGELGDGAVEDARLLMRALFDYWDAIPNENPYKLGNRNLAMRIYLLYRDTLFPEGDTANEDLENRFDNDMWMKASETGPLACDPDSCSCSAGTENHLMLFNSFTLLSKQAAGVEPTEPGYVAVRDWWAGFLPHAVTGGFSEWASTGIYEKWTWTAILNLADFSEDQEVRDLATAAIDYNLALQAGQSAAGGYFASGGTRAYPYEILGDYRQARTHMAQMLMTGGDLGEHSGGIHGPVAFAASNYQPLSLVDRVFREGLTAGQTAKTTQTGRYRQSCSPWYQHTYRGATFAIGANQTPRSGYYAPHDTVIGYVSSTASPKSHVVPIGYHPLEFDRYARHDTTKLSERGFGHKNVLIYTQGGVADGSSADVTGPQPPRLFVSSDFTVRSIENGWAFMSNGETYVAWQPSVGSPQWDDVDPPRQGEGYFARSSNGNITEAGETCALEVGDAELFGSYQQFKQNVKARVPNFNGQNYTLYDNSTIEYLPGSPYRYRIDGGAAFTPSQVNWPRADMSHLQGLELSFGGDDLTFDPSDVDSDQDYLEGYDTRLESRYRFGGGRVLPPSGDGLIVLGPSDVEAYEDDEAVILIAATGGLPPYTFRWQHRADGQADFSNVVLGGAYGLLPSGSLRVGPAAFEHQGTYRVQVEDLLGEEVLSREAYFTVKEKLRVTDPSDAEAPLGGEAGFGALATGGAGHWGYIWEHSESLGGPFSPVDELDPAIRVLRAPDGNSGVTIDPVAISHAGWYRVRVGDGERIVISNPASLTVTGVDPPLEVSSPADAEAELGASASFSVTAAGGSGAYTFAWQRRSTDGGAYQPIQPGGPFTIGGDGAVSQLTIDPVAAEHAGWYRAVVDDGEETVESGEARLTVTSPPAVGVIAADSFTNSGPDRQVGAGLDGAVVEEGRLPLRSWRADASVVFGTGSIRPETGAAVEEHVGSVPLQADDTAAGPVLTLSADVYPGSVGATDWVAIGFWKTATGGFFSGEVWMLLRPSGGVTVNVDGPNAVLNASCAELGCDFFPTGPNRLTLEYDTAAKRVSAWVNGVNVLALWSVGDFTPELSYAAVDFRNLGQADAAKLDNFDVSVSEETAVPPLSISSPVDVQATEGDSPSFSVTATGGTGDYSFNWQRSDTQGGAYTTVSGAEYVVSNDGGDSMLTIESVTLEHAGWYRAQVHDGLTLVSSPGAQLVVSEEPIELIANPDPGTGDPEPFTFTTPESVYLLRHQLVLANDQPSSGTTVHWHSQASVGNLESDDCGPFRCFYYDPPVDFLGGEVTFQYRMTNDGGITVSNQATVTLTIPADLVANPDPDPSAPGSLTFTSYRDVYWIAHSTLLGNDLPAAGTEISSWTDPAAGQMWRQQWQGSWYFYYDPPEDYAGGEITFTYRMRLTGTTAESEPAEVRVQLPADLVAKPDSLSFGTYAPSYTFPHSQLLANDLPSSGTQVSSFTQPVDGTLQSNGADFTYTPPTNFAGGEVSFTYRIRLIDDPAESDEGPVTLTIPPPPLPSASFSFECLGLTCDFDASSSTGLDLSYAWSFGDSASGSGATATHTYAFAGDFTAELVVTDGFGRPASTSQLVQPVSAAPDERAVVFPGPHLMSAGDLLGNDSGPEGLEIWAILTWPTRGSLELETATYPDGAIHTLRYTPSECGGSDTFSYWLLVGGGTQTQDEGLVTVDILPDAPPIADFAVTCQNRTCSFQDTSSDDSGYDVVGWDFGDGSTAGADPNPVHEYAPGTYSVTLTVVDLCGQPDAVTRQVEVTGSGFGTSELLYDCQGLECSFDASAFASGVGAAALEWDFGDGTVASGAEPTHRFPLTDDGLFEVTLVVETEAVKLVREVFVTEVQVLSRRQALELLQLLD